MQVVSLTNIWLPIPLFFHTMTWYEDITQEIHVIFASGLRIGGGLKWDERLLVYELHFVVEVKISRELEHSPPIGD
jgi:hypothetical protein